MENKKRKKISIKWKVPAKWTLFGLAIGVVIATIGSVAALNGWFGGGSSIPEDTMTRGLVGYWGFDEGSGTVAHDASDYANNGIFTNGPSWATGKVGGAGKFDGIDDYVLVTSSPSLKNFSAMTIEFWVNTAKKTAPLWQELMGDGYWDEPNYGFRVAQDNDNTNIINFILRSTQLNGTVVSATFVDDTWTHVAMTWNGTTMTPYTNGAAGTAAAYSGAVNPLSNLVIGARDTTPNQPWGGKLDEVRIYSRALSAEEIRYHYNRGGPVAEWKMDEGSGRTVYDSTDNNNDGTLVLGGSATSSAWVSGKFGTALTFDGVDDYVLSATSETDLTTFTAEVWLKPNTVTPTGTKEFVSHGASPTDNGWSFEMPSGQNRLRLTFHGVGNYDSPLGVLTAGQWQHAVVTLQGTTATFYIDGKQVGIKTTGSMGVGTHKYGIGAYPNGNNPFNGSIDDVRIYNYVRSADEIRLDYNAGFAAKFGYTNAGCQKDPASCMTQGLVGYWGFDEGSGKVVHDASNYANNGVASSSWAGGNPPAGGGGAGKFDGTDDYVEVPNSSSIIMGTSDFSYYFWFKTSMNAAGTMIWQGPFDKRYFIDFRGDMSGVLQWNIYDGVTSVSGFSTGGSLADGQWHFAAMVHSRNGNGQLYIDGKANNVPADISAVGNLDNTDNLWIGARDGGSVAFNGLIDEVRIYNRALSVEEIRYHYNKGGPVGYWKFDEGSGRTAYDSTGNNNDGTLVLAGSATSSAWVSGKYGSALSFDGVDDYVDAGNGASLMVTTDFTFEAWVRVNNTSTVRAIMGKGTIAGSRGYTMDITAANKFYLDLGDSDGAWGLNWTTNYTVTDFTNFIHMVMLRNGSTVYAYVNGIRVDSTTYATAIKVNTVNLAIGQNAIGNPSNNFNGLIDDVRIYNYARTQDEIRLDYNAGLAAKLGPSGKDCNTDPASCMTEGLLGYWAMDEGSGSVVRDQSGNNNNGTTSDTAPSWIKGKVGSALSFDGNDDVVVVPNFGLKMPSSEITVEAWINPATSTAYDDLIGLNPFESPLNNRFNIHFPWDNSIYWQFGNPISGQGCSTALNSDWLGVWGHYVFTYSYSLNKSAIYRNGVQLTSGLANNPFIPYNASLRIGGRATYTFQGKIDELRIYNRALSDKEVRYHYNRGGPVAQWKMDEGVGGTVYDSTNNNNDGTMYYMSTSTSGGWVAGKYGSALSFDGVDDRVSTPITSFSGWGSVTYEAWVKDRGGSSCRRIIDKGGGRTGLSIDCYSNLTWEITNTSAVTVRVYISDPTTNVWTHIVGTYDGSETRLYINGVVAGSKKQSGAIQDIGDALYVGATGGGGSGYYNGSLDDVRIYNYARTEEQVRQDYNQGMGTRLK